MVNVANVYLRNANLLFLLVFSTHHSEHTSSSLPIMHFYTPTSAPVETEKGYSLMHSDGHAVSMVITGVNRLTIPERLIQEVKVRINPCSYTQNEDYLFNNTFCSYCLLLMLALNTSTHQLECLYKTAKV